MLRVTYLRLYQVLKPFNSGWLHMATAHTGVPTLELRDVAKSFGAVDALESGSIRAGAATNQGQEECSHDYYPHDPATR